MGRSTTILVALANTLLRAPAPTIFHDHTSWASGDPRPPFFLRAAIRLGVERYLGVDQRLCDWARRHLRVLGDRIDLVPNAVDLPRFGASMADPSVLHPPGRVILVAVANLRPVKNQALLLRAVAASPHREQLQLVLVGEASGSYADACRALIADLALDDHVQLLGRTTDVPSVLAAADVGVLSSTSESGPLAVLEYMAAGLPVVATETGEVAATARRHGLAGFVPEGDAQAFSQALTAVVEATPAERSARGRGNRDFVQRHFSMDAYVERMAAIYASLG